MTEERLSRPNNVFRAALFLSALIHVLGLLYLKLPPPSQILQGKPALSVILAKPKDVGSPIPEPISSSPIKRQPLEESSLPVTQPVQQEEVKIEASTAETSLEMAAEPDAGETLQDVPADPVTPSAQIVEAGKVQVVLQIGENGAVRQIIWNALPAITDRALQHMEAQLRMKIYLVTGSSYTVTEIVEIPRE